MHRFYAETGTTLRVGKNKTLNKMPVVSLNGTDFLFFSLSDSAVNLQQTHVEISHHALSMSLHYLVKC